MRLIFALLLFPTFTFAAKLPVDLFDQAKLETLLRGIPSALTKTETHPKFVRKHYVFPKNKKASFQIKCQADYFGEAQFPSFKSCEMHAFSKDLAGDEYLLKITDTSVVKELRDAISYGDDIKKLYSHQRAYGQAADGAYRSLFRYMFICKSDACDVSYTMKEEEVAEVK